MDDASRTLGLPETHPGLILADQNLDYTQGSQSCTTRNDVMHDPLLQGVKKRKVNTPVVVCIPGALQPINRSSVENRIQ
jgi:hypothetical protein